MKKVEWCFFSLPFFLLAGTSAQSAGLYLCGIILPWIFLSNSLKVPRRFILQLSCILFILYSVFCFSNLYAYYFSLHDYTIRMAKLLESQISSSVFISAIFLLLIAQKNGPKSEINFLKLSVYFNRGLLAASLLLLIYILIQHVTGFDYRKEGYILEDAKLMGQRYRVMGLYGHPLSLAGAALAVFSFYLSIFFEHYKLKSVSRSFWAFLHAEEVWISGAISLIHLAFIFLSGGRAPLGVALSLFLAVPAFVLGFGQLRKVKIKMYALVSCLGGIFLWGAGILQRYIELWEHLQNKAIDRFIFWKVHWQIFLDHPFFGQGAALLKAGQRVKYYNEMGYGLLRDKYNAHNIYLETLASTGAFGFFVILAATLYLLWFLNKQKELGLLAKAFFVSVAANALNGFTQNTFFDSNVIYIYLGFFWLMIWTVILVYCEENNLRDPYDRNHQVNTHRRQ